jgi:hypothetical protein
VIVPASLTLPRRPETLPAGVVVGATPIEPEECPQAPRLTALRALLAGWEVIVTYAVGQGSRKVRNYFAPNIEAKNDRKFELLEVPCLIESWAVRSLDPSTEYRFTVWHRPIDEASGEPILKTDGKPASVGLDCSWSLTRAALTRLSGDASKDFPQARGTRKDLLQEEPSHHAEAS